MSWKGRGSLASGPPLASGGTGKRLVDRYRPNGEGITAFERDTRGAEWYRRPGAEKGAWDDGERKSEWDVLKENHRFIRDDEEPGEVSWEERLARAYESKLFKEFALIDLKHYKSKRLALRWRTAPEVVDGIGEDTCGSLRCKHHHPHHSRSDDGSEDASEASGSNHRRDGAARHRKRRNQELQLRAFELPFAYQEAGERKEALVKVKLCKRCERKLVWKPGKEGSSDESDIEAERRARRRQRHREDRGLSGRRGSKERSIEDAKERTHRRSQSPDGSRVDTSDPNSHRGHRPSRSPDRAERRPRIDRSVVFRDP